MCSSPGRLKPKTLQLVFAVFRRKSKDWLARNQDNVYKWGDMSMMMSVCTRPTDVIVLVHWNYSPRVDISLHSDTLFWYRPVFVLGEHAIHYTTDAVLLTRYGHTMGRYIMSEICYIINMRNRLCIHLICMIPEYKWS